MDHPGTEDKREQPYRKNLISRKRLERKKGDETRWYRPGIGNAI